LDRPNKRATVYTEGDKEVKFTKSKIKDMIMEAIAERLAENFPGSESAVGSPAREAQGAIIQQLSVGVQGAIFDILEEMSADEHIVDLLSRAGEMSPEAEAVNAAILSGVRKGTENYGRKLGLMGGPKPAQAVAEELEDDLAEATYDYYGKPTKRGHNEYDEHGRKIPSSGKGGYMGYDQQAAVERERKKQYKANVDAGRARFKAAAKAEREAAKKKRK